MLFILQLTHAARIACQLKKGLKRSNLARLMAEMTRNAIVETLWRYLKYVQEKYHFHVKQTDILYHIQSMQRTAYYSNQKYTNVKIPGTLDRHQTNNPEDRSREELQLEQSS